MKQKNNVAIVYAIIAAMLYAINIPLSKLLLKTVSATMMAALLYLGAGIGLSSVFIVRKLCTTQKPGLRLTRKELPYTLGMIFLDIAAPILLMLGLNGTTAESASLLNNFEIVATSVIALVVFKELVSKRLWIAISLITLSSLILSLKDVTRLTFSFHSLFILVACIAWGFENNCTRMLSSKSTAEIVVLKGMFSGLGSLLIALALGEQFPPFSLLFECLLLGFFSYGLSIYFYILAQRYLGAAKTSAYYAVSPFLGVAFSFLLLHEVPNSNFLIALAVMLIGTYFSVTDTIATQHTS
ncbi:MAG: DMT family transporter [Oscillospiraceae bacterium]